MSLLECLQRGKTILCLQVHDILWNHSIMEENKILLYRWHLTKWALSVRGSCPSVVQTVNFVIVNSKKGILFMSW